MAEAVQVLRALHILFAALWFGAGMFWFLIMRPTMKGHEATAKQILGTSKYGPMLGVTSLLTVVFGVATITAAPSGTYTATQMMVLGPGMLAGVLGFLVGWGGHMPAGIKMQKAHKTGDEERFWRLAAVEHKLDVASFALILVAGVAMVGFRLV